MDRLIRKIRPHLLSWLNRSRSGTISFVRRFSYKDIKWATDDFHRIIYSDSHETAYKARFQDGDIVLVKEVKDLDQGRGVFYNEVQLLGRLYHRHLLALKGFSIGHKRLLVFDNIENGSLKEHLNGNLQSRIFKIYMIANFGFVANQFADPLKTPLNWKTRLQIAVGVVAALEYLFLFSNPPVYHVSISSSSIMLDENFTAKVSNVSILDCVGNYVAMPQASCADSMNERCGNIVFQLGVLILELITGQSSERGSSDIIQWIQGSRFHSSIQKMIDPDLGNSYDSRELENLLAVARLCIKSGDKPKFPILHIFRYLQKKVNSI